MKKIVILQIPNSKNNGSAMMAINSITHFHNYFNSNVEFYCDFSTQYDHDRIASELKNDVKVNRLDFPQFQRGPNLATSVINSILWINKIVKNLEEHKPDAVIVLGGDDFSEYYSGYKIIIRLYQFYKISQKLPVFLIGHTIGPFCSWRKKAFSILMSKCRIITRDELSLNHCKNDLKVKHVEQGHDLAWFDLPKQSNDLKYKMIIKYGLEENKYITIIPSALVKHYTSNSEDYFNSWKKLIEKLQTAKYQIVLMPHVFNDKKKDDRWAINEIAKRLVSKNNIIFIEDILLPSECRSILSCGHFSISCRMHSAISSLQTAKPTIALSYSTKYAGVISGDVGMPSLVIEATDDKLWENGIVEIINQKVSHIENNYDEITNSLSKRVDEIKDDESNILNRYAEIINENKGRPFSE
jgi:colanic acid/amylovoran biosynthesis protein